MNSSTVLQFQEYKGKLLTSSEVALAKYFDEKEKLKREEAEEQKAMRIGMVQSARAVMANATAAAAAAEAQIEADTKLQQQKVAEKSEPLLVSGQKRKLPADSNAEPVAVSGNNNSVIAMGTNLGGKSSNDAADSDDDLVQPMKKPAAAAATAKIRKAQTLQEADEEDQIIAQQMEQDTQRLFSPSGMLSEVTWGARTSSECLKISLPDFSLNHKQTLALQLTVPASSSEWSLNITPEDDRFNSDILMHFNPRYKKSTLILNDKQGTWGFTVKRSLGQSSKTDGLLARDVTLMIQVRDDGFYMFANGMYNSFFPHRRDVTKFDALKVILNAADDNGNAYDVVLKKVWWDHRDTTRDQVPSTAAEIIDRLKAEHEVAAASVVPMSRRTLQVQGLPKGMSDLRTLQALEYTMYKVFNEFNPEAVVLVPMQGIGFVRLRTAEEVEPAIEALDGVVVEGNDSDGDASDNVEYEISLKRMIS